MNRVLALAVVLLAAQVRADEVLVVAAASTSEALTEIARAFEAKTGVHVAISFAGSSLLARQIEQGAPADLFLSADEAQMKRVASRVKAQRPLLGNRLVVIAPTGATPPRSAEALVTLRRLALADPAAVPAGVYAKAWLTGLGLWPRLAPRVLPTLDVRAALAAVESRAAPAGVVYATDAATSQKVQIAFAVDPKAAPEIVYPLALLKHGGDAAQRFYAFLAGAEAKAAFERRGFTVR